MIDRINTLPHDALRFRDFACLKSGRDNFSRLRLPQLIEMVSRLTAETVADEFEHDRDRAVCLRWHLRGLDLDKAIRKVRVDLEITENAIMARRAA